MQAWWERRGRQRTAKEDSTEKNGLWEAENIAQIFITFSHRRITVEPDAWWDIPAASNLSWLASRRMPDRPCLLIPNSAITVTADSFAFRSYCTHKPHFPMLHALSYYILCNIFGCHTKGNTVMASHRPTQALNDGEGLVVCQQSVSGSEWMSLTDSQSAVDAFVALPNGRHTRVSFTAQLTCRRESERSVTWCDRPVCIYEWTTKPWRGFACVSVERLWSGTQVHVRDHARRCVYKRRGRSSWPGNSQMGKRHHRGLLETTCGEALESNVAWSVYVLHVVRSTVHQSEEASALPTTPAVEWPRRPHLRLPASS